MATAAETAPLQTQPDWRVSRRPSDILLALLAWLVFVWLIYEICFPVAEPVLIAPYLLFILYFARLYYRLLAVPIWALDTLSLLQRRLRAGPTLCTDPVPIIVLIAAYRAQSSIGPVLQCLNLQAYPSDRFHVFVVTQEAEKAEQHAQFQAVEREVRTALLQAKEAARGSQAAIRTLSRLFQEACDVPQPIVELAGVAAAHACLGTPKKKTLARLADILMTAYYRAYRRGESRQFVDRLREGELSLLLSPLLTAHLDALAGQCFRSADGIIADFSRVLGLPAGASIFRDPSKPLRIGTLVHKDRIQTAWRRYWVARSLRRVCVPLLPWADRELPALKSRLLQSSEFSCRLRAAYESQEVTCPEAVESTIRAIGRANFHHICRSKVGGGKPESLNTAFLDILTHRPNLLGRDTHFLVIDADSLLHSSTLSVISSEIRADTDHNVIRQLAPLSTSNYACNNVFVKMIACLDTIGSMGKWARSTRTQARPDLPAGSGLVVPAALLEHLRATKGAPWEARTITEDARLVISDFGLMDGVTRKTKFVPVHMLEAVPEAPGVAAAYRQYWTQRMRWASGGPDELIELWKAFRGDAIYVRSNTANPSFQVERPTRVLDRAWSRFRHLHLLFSWLNDHLWWGAGYGMAPLLWLWFTYFHLVPPTFSILGVSLLLGCPALVIFGVFARFREFVPGSLSLQGLCRLYLGVILLAWFHTWPIMYTQAMYLLGRRDRFRTWTTTSKPSF